VEEEGMSTHEVPVVRVVKEPHPSADTLSIARIFGFTCCVRTADWNDGDLAAYIAPDYTVPLDRPEFAFLARVDKPKDRERIKVKKLRGVFSQGLLIRAPEGLREGDNAMEALGVERYQPPFNLSTGGEAGPGPSGVVAPKYDVESWYRYGSLFQPGEDVIATEKLHGASARYVFAEGRMFVGSHGEWKREGIASIWHRALEVTPRIRTLCEAWPGFVLYGEVYGQVQDLRYGTRKGEVCFAGFDIRDKAGQWLNGKEACATAFHFGVPWVPEVYAGKYDPAAIEALSNGPSLVPGEANIREGVVVQALSDRYVDELGGRLKLKIVSNAYLERA